MSTHTATDFTTVTELPDSRATADQCATLINRYHLARGHSKGRMSWKLAVAAAGLGYLAQTARTVVGGDINAANYQIARAVARGLRQIRN